MGNSIDGGEDVRGEADDWNRVQGDRLGLRLRSTRRHLPRGSDAGNWQIDDYTDGESELHIRGQVHEEVKRSTRFEQEEAFH